MLDDDEIVTVIVIVSAVSILLLLTAATIIYGVGIARIERRNKFRIGLLSFLAIITLLAFAIAVFFHYPSPL